jgi:RNA polymerase sigma-70 factor (ECF subfamily)
LAKQPDITVFEQIQRGNTSAFNALVAEWQDSIHRFAYRFFYDADDAQEITQKTFIRVFSNLDQLDDPDKFSSWIYRIAKNLCLDELKRAGRKKSSPLELVKSERIADGNPAKKMEAKELGEWIQKALLAIPEEQRVVIIMKEYEGLTFKEIAEILDESESTVKSRLYYGFKKLRDILNSWNINTNYLNNE